MLPWVAGKRVLPVRRKIAGELLPLLLRKTRADADMLQHASLVVQAQQQGAYLRVLAVLVPAKSGNHAVAIALMLHLQHDAFVRLVHPCPVFGDDTVQTRALKASKPVFGDAGLRSGRRDVNGRGHMGEHLQQALAAKLKRGFPKIAFALAQQVENDY